MRNEVEYGCVWEEKRVSNNGVISSDLNTDVWGVLNETSKFLLVVFYHY